MAGGLGNVLTDFLRFINAGADTVRVLELLTTGANGATTKIRVGNRNPVGAVTGEPGSFYARVDPGGIASAFYLHVGAVADNTSWGSIAVGDFLKRDGSLAMLADLNFGGFKGVSLADPTAAQDAATKAYVDAQVAGARDVKDSVRAATTANIVLSAPQTIDGVAVIAGNRVLVKNQATAADNGIYVVAAGAWARSTDADSDAEVTAGLYTWVTEGTANVDTGWLLVTDDPITLGVTSLSFTQVSALGQVTAGAGLTKTGATLDVGPGSGIQVNADSIETIKASTTEVLTGTDAVKAVTPDALAALWEKGANVASAATVTLDEGGYFHITGVTTITDIDFTTPKDGRLANVIFDGVLTLTHSATLQLPGGANILTAAGDRATFVQDAGDTVICTDYQRAAQLYGAPTKEVFFGTGATNAARGDYPVLNLGSGGSGDFGFYVPHDFVSLVSIVLVAIPGGTVGAANIDLLSDYGSAAAAQQFNNHSESNAVITYALTAGQLTELDVSSVFSLLAALDYAGFHINHTGVTGGVDYLGIRLRYQ